MKSMLKRFKLKMVADRLHETSERLTATSAETADKSIHH
jgi:hypothetical protein